MTKRCNRTLTDLVAAEAARHVRPATGLVFVPELADALAGEADPDELRDALLCLARAGRIELQPESGMGRLSARQLEACPPGPQGTRLSWARLPDEREQRRRDLDEREAVLRDLLCRVQKGRR